MNTARIPPVDPTPATIAAVLAMHAGHIFPSSELCYCRKLFELCCRCTSCPYSKAHISIAYLLIPIDPSSHIALFSIFTTFLLVDCLHLLIRLPGAGGYGQVHIFIFIAAKRVWIETSANSF